MTAAKRLITFFCISLVFVVPEKVIAQQDEKALASRLNSLSRKNLNDTTKRLCLLQFSNAAALQALAPYATVSQMCQCIICETTFAVSDRLAEALLRAQVNHMMREKNDKLAANGAFGDYSTKYTLAGKLCVEEFIRRSQ